MPRGTPRPAPESRSYRAAIALSVVAVAGAAAFLASDRPADVRESFSTIALLLGGIAGTAATTYRALLSTGRRRRAWRLMAAGLAMGVIGNLWLALGPPQAAVIGDVTLILGLGAGIAALLSYPTVRRRGIEAAGMVLDGLVIGGSVLYITSLVVYPELTAGGQGSSRQLLALVFPLVDVLLVTLAVLLIIRVGRADRPALALLGAGLSLYAVADLAFAARSASGTFTVGSLLDVGWIAGYALVVLAALHPAPEVSAETDEHPRSSSVAGTVVTFGIFLVAAAFGYISETERGVPPFGGPVWIAVLLAVAVRQILLIMDNENLRQGLEERVRERTAELSKSTEQRELLLRSVGDGIYGVDRSGRITFVNPAAEATLGRPAAGLIGVIAHDAFHATRPDGTPYPIGDCYITHAIERGAQTVAEEDVYRSADGSEVPVEVTASPLSSDEGIRGAVVVFRDVTERHEVDRLKDEFVSVVSHELRTPLAAIRGSLGLVAGGALGAVPPKAMRMVTIAMESSVRLSRLINDILDLERIDADAPMRVADHSVAALVDGALDQMRVVAENAGVELVRVRANGRVRADADRVIQTLVNLIGNAIKFSRRGAAVEVEAVEDGTWILFRVTDHGVGVPVDRLETIFERFEQADSSDARARGGSGLGLTISRAIVERHGGRIWAESRPGEGATFRFTLPRAV